MKNEFDYLNDVVVDLLRYEDVVVNEGKREYAEVDGVIYGRYAVKTHVVTDKDRLDVIAKKYIKPKLAPGDVVFISEKMVACTQGRAIHLDKIRPRKLAVYLSSKVYKNPGGIGLAMPETMEMALRECGVWRILLAAAVHCVGRLFGQRGWFYIMAGRKAASIDGPCHYTLPPYNQYVVLWPKEPAKAAKKVAEILGVPVLIVDINDLGGEILGSSERVDKKLYCEILRDNPLGQSDQCTPCGIIRKK